MKKILKEEVDIMGKKVKSTHPLTTVVIIFIMTVFLMLGLAGCTGTDVSETPSESDGQQSETETEGKQDDSTGQGTETADRSGTVVGTKQVIDAQFDEAYPYSEGFAVVGQDTGSGMKYNYIDLDGNYLLQEWVDMAYSFSDGMACVGTKVEPEGDAYIDVQLYLFGYVDTAGQMAVEAEYVGSEYIHPLCFYQGYAEVQYYKLINDEYSSFYGMYCNVIDRQGNRLFDFDVEAFDDYGYGMGPDERILSLNWELGWSDYCYYNKWMYNYVNNPGRNSVLWDGSMSYMVSPDGSIINTVSGYAHEIKDGFYSISGYNEDGRTESAGLYDAEWNLLREGLYYDFTFGPDWFEEVLNIPAADGIGISGSQFRIWDRDLQSVTDEIYWNIYETYENGTVVGYIVRDEQMVWKYMDKELHEVFKFGGEYDYVEKLTNSFVDYNQFIATIYSGRIYDSSTTVLFDEQGRILRTQSGGSVSYRIVSREVLLEYLYGESNRLTLIDYAGNELLDIPLYAYIDIKGTEDAIQIAGYTTSPEDNWARTYYIMDIAKVNGQWEIKGMQEISSEEYYAGALSGGANDEIPAYILAENDVSHILGVYMEYYTEDAGTLSLEDASGKVLEPAQAALSLVEDDLYLAAGKIQPTDPDYGWKIEVTEMYLQNTEQTLSGEVYEMLGLLSEDRISFRENGKWGYLELIREIP